MSKTLYPPPAGVAHPGTPAVEMVLIKSLPLQVFDCTPPSVDAEGLGNCDAATLPLMSEKAGCVALGTPEVEMVLIHFEPTAASDSIPPSVDALGLGRKLPVRLVQVVVGAASEFRVNAVTT